VGWRGCGWSKGVMENKVVGGAQDSGWDPEGR
jgi:hypothetical protein